MPQIPSRLPREYESPSPDHRTWYTVVVNTVLRYSNVLHLHQRVCHKVGDTMVRTSRFTLTQLSPPCSHFFHLLLTFLCFKLFPPSSCVPLLTTVRSCHFQVLLFMFHSVPNFFHFCHLFHLSRRSFLEETGREHRHTPWQQERAILL